MTSRERIFRPKCMEDGCTRAALWISDDGYKFCEPHGYAIYLQECELEGIPESMRYQQWLEEGRPHGARPR